MANLRTGFGKVELWDDFLLSADHSGWNDNTENSGTAAQLANREDGYLNLATGTTGGNRSQVTGERVFRAESGGPLIFEAGVVPVTAVTLETIFAGWTDVTTIETPIESAASGDTITTNASDSVGFLYDTQMTTDRWFLVGVDSDVDASGGGVVGEGGTGYNDANIGTPVADTDQALRLVTFDDGSTQFYINGIEVWKATDAGWTNRRLQSSVSPDVNLCPTVAVETRTTAAKSVYVDYLYGAKARNP